ncbi:MAG: hypothetical protein CH6_2545 [Candidatus Kapaibacterium sp.]|nr:MAG: hypothetical protein CH6_2545 [Candidatus Kapabacteria bacterium]
MNLPNEIGKFSQNTKLIEKLNELRNTLNLYATFVDAKEGVEYHAPRLLSSFVSLPLDTVDDLSNLTSDFLSEKLTTLIEQQLEKAGLQLFDNGKRNRQDYA